MIVSITLDRKEGGIANSLISYSKALELIDEEHLVLLPKTAPVIKALESLGNVKILEVNKTVLYFHLYTKFLFKPWFAKELNFSKCIFLHNSKLVKHFKHLSNKVGLINHSGKLRNTVHNACNIFITSAGLSRFLAKHPQNNSRNLVICHGFAEPTSIDINSRQDSDYLRVMSAGRFIEKKGFEDLIDAAYLLEQQNVKVQVKLYGDGVLREKLEQKIETLGLQNLTLMGWHPSLEEEYLKHDVFCVPSLQEPFGLIIGEAMMSGLAVVSTKTDGALEIFGDMPEQRGGILVDLSAPEQLAKAIVKIQDMKFKDELSENAQKNIKTNFSLEKLSLSIKNLIKDAI